MLAIVAIYSLRFLHARVAKAYESCRNFVEAPGVLRVNTDGFLPLLAGGLGLPNGAVRFVRVCLAIVVLKIEKSGIFLCGSGRCPVLLGFAPVFAQLFRGYFCFLVVRQAFLCGVFRWGLALVCGEVGLSSAVCCGGLPKGTILVRISVVHVGCAASWCVMVLLGQVLVMALPRILCATAGLWRQTVVRN